MHTFMAHLGRHTGPCNTEFILSVDHFTWVGARNPGSLGILGQETLIRGFRDTVGNSVHCSLLFPASIFLSSDGLEKVLDSEAGNHSQTHHWQIGRPAAGAELPEDTVTLCPSCSSPGVHKYLQNRCFTSSPHLGQEHFTGLSVCTSKTSSCCLFVLQEEKIQQSYWLVLSC